MPYYITDVVGKLVKIDEKIESIYNDISNYSKKLKVTSRVLAKDKQRQVSVYTGFENKIKVDEKDFLDYLVYDKVSSLISQLDAEMQLSYPANTKDLLVYALDIESRELALQLDVKGRLLSLNTTQNEVMDFLIGEEKKHIVSINNFLI